MKISYIFIGLLLIRFSINSSDVITLDLYYEEILENAKGKSYFRIPVYEGEEMSLIVKAYKPNYGNDFYVYICYFDHYPEDSEITDGYNSWIDLTQLPYYDGENYDYIMYEYKLPTRDAKYLGAYFYTNQDIRIGLYTKSRYHVYDVSLLQDVDIRDCFEPNYFRIASFSNDKAAIKTKVYHPYYTNRDDFQVWITGYSSRPTDYVIRTTTNWTRLTNYEYMRGGQYDSFSYPFETIDNVAYLGFYFQCKSYDYVTFWVYSEKGMKLLILLIIILAPLIVIGAVIGIVIKKTGCCRGKDNN